jgi:hypothetical protein
MPISYSLRGMPNLGWEKCPWKIEYFLEDLFLGSQWSIILRYRRLSDKSKEICFDMIDHSLDLSFDMDRINHQP